MLFMKCNTLCSHCKHFLLTPVPTISSQVVIELLLDHHFELFCLAQSISSNSPQRGLRFNILITGEPMGVSDGGQLLDNENGNWDTIRIHGVHKERC